MYRPTTSGFDSQTEMHGFIFILSAFYHLCLNLSGVFIVTWHVAITSEEFKQNKTKFCVSRGQWKSLLEQQLHQQMRCSGIYKECNNEGIIYFYLFLFPKWANRRSERLHDEGQCRVNGRTTTLCVVEINEFLEIQWWIENARWGNIIVEVASWILSGSKHTRIE